MRVTKKTIVLDYLKNHTGLDNRKAVIELGVGDLAGTIRDLRESGVNIMSVKMEGQDRYGNKTNYVEYRLVRTGRKPLWQSNHYL